MLQSQNEGWPEEHRDAARRDLNRVYDLFVSLYGPINKTTFGETADGTVIRRMPNLVKFREDPDAMLVMSLEDYDEATGKAKKAAIMTKDVVGQSPPITSVTSAEEGLLVSLDRRGAVDLRLHRLALREVRRGHHRRAFRPNLPGPREQRPGRRQTPTSRATSGRSSPRPRVPDRTTQETRRPFVPSSPRTFFPGDIDANLGAPWIPEEDIQRLCGRPLSRLTLQRSGSGT